MSLTAQPLTQLLHRVASGDPQAREDLIVMAHDRLELMARRMMRSYPRVKRWEQTADLLQNALIRLNRALHVVAPASTQAFLGLASEQIRRELIDLARHYCGPHGHDRHYIGSVDDTQTPEAESDLHDHQELELWTALHVSVTTLPTWEREVFDLRFYYGWTPQGNCGFLQGQPVDCATRLAISGPTLARKTRRQTA